MMERTTRAPAVTREQSAADFLQHDPAGIFESLESLETLGLVRSANLPKRTPGQMAAAFGPVPDERVGATADLVARVGALLRADYPSRGRAEESPGPGDHHIEGARWIHRIRLWWA